MPSPDRATVRAIAAEAGVGWLAGTEAGLYVSPELGGSWELRSPADWSVLSVLVTSRDTVLVGSYRKGIERSVDLGRSWESVGFDGNVYVDGLLESHDGSILAAVAGSVADQPTGVFRSADDGLTWTSIGPEGDHVYSVSEPVPGQLYAGAASGAYRSSDSGASWSRVEGLSAATPLSSVVSVGSVLVAGFAEPRYRAPGAGARRSLDGGLTWQEMDGLPSETSVHALVAIGSTLFAATGDVLGRGGSGLYRTSSGGAWALEGLDGQWLQALLTAPSGELVAGATETGVLAFAPASGTWRPLGSGLRNWNPTALATDAGGALFALSLRSLFGYDEASGQWRETGLPEAAAPATPFNFGALDDGTLVLPAACGLLFSEGISGPHAPRQVPGALGDPFYVQLIGRDGAIATFPGDAAYATEDRGSTWQRRPVPEGTRGVFVDRAGTMLAFGDGLYRASEDLEWESAGPPEAIIFTVVACGEALYAGSAPLGVLVSRDGGRSWLPSMDKLRPGTQQPGYVAAHSILCLPGARPLAATFDDGVWELGEDGAWIDVSSGLPTKNIGDLASAPDGTVYLVTVAGVFESRAWAR